MLKAGSRRMKKPGDKTKAWPGKASALDVANYFLELAEADEKSVDPMKLQKLLYYAQGWALVENDGMGLFEEPIEAWTWGPVVHLVWKAHPGSRPIHLDEYLYDLDDDDKAIIAEVWESYKRYSSTELSDMTHHERPWLEARKNLRKDVSSDVPLSLVTMWETIAEVAGESSRWISENWDAIAETTPKTDA